MAPNKKTVRFFRAYRFNYFMYCELVFRTFPIGLGPKDKIPDIIIGRF